MVGSKISQEKSRARTPSIKFTTGLFGTKILSILPQYHHKQSYADTLYIQTLQCRLIHVSQPRSYKRQE